MSTRVQPFSYIIPLSALHPPPSTLATCTAPIAYQRTPFRRREPPSSPEEMRPYFSECEYDNYQPHFLDSCSLCHKSLSLKSDIFMYRGNTPFCSLECRQEQIEMDESREKRWRVSSSSSSSSFKRSNSNRQNSEPPNQSETKKAVRTGTVVVA